MAITKAQQSALTNSSFAAGGVWSPTTVSITGVTAGNLLVVVSGLWDSGRGTGAAQGIHGDSNGTLVGATNANPNLNAAGSPPGWPVAPQISHILSAAAGTHTITPVVVNSGGDGYLSAIEFSGGGAGTWTQVDGGTGYAGSSTIGAVDTVTATTVGTAAQVGDLVISVTAIDGDPTALGMSNPSNGSWTNLVTTSTTGDSVTIGAAYRIATVAGAQSAVWDSVDAACQQNFAAIAVYRFTPSGPTINTPPASTIAKVGSTAGFSVSATASAGSLTYQWQSRSSGAWADIGGATSASYTTPTLAAGDSAGYRCNVTDSNGTVATDEAVLTVALPQKLWRRQPSWLTIARPFEALQGKAKAALVAKEFFGAVDTSTGASSGTITLTGSSAAAAPTAASSSATITMTGVSEANGGAVTGSSSGTLTLTGSAAGSAPATGASAQTVSLSGSAAGNAPATASSSGSISLSGSSAAAALATASSSVTVALAGAASAAATAAASSSGTVPFTGSSTATAPTAASSSGTVALSGSSAASALAVGSSAGTITLAGSAAGSAPAAGTSSLTISVSGSAAGSAPATAASSTTLSIGGSSTASAPATAGSSSTFPLTGSSTGTTGNSATAGSSVTIPISGSSTAAAAAAAASAATLMLSGASTGTAQAGVSSSASFFVTGVSAASAIARADSSVAIVMAGQSAAQVQAELAEEYPGTNVFDAQVSATRLLASVSASSARAKVSTDSLSVTYSLWRE